MTRRPGPRRPLQLRPFARHSPEVLGPRRLRGPGGWAWRDGARPRLASQVPRRGGEAGRGPERAEAPSPRSAFPAGPAGAPRSSCALPPAWVPSPRSVWRCGQAGDGAAGAAPLAPLLAFHPRRRRDGVGEKLWKVFLAPCLSGAAETTFCSELKSGTALGAGLRERRPPRRLSLSSLGPCQDLRICS